MKKETTRQELVIFKGAKGQIKLRGDFRNETLWATQAQIADLFAVNPQAITKRLKNIYHEVELSESSTCSKMEQVQTEGSRTVHRTVNLYNLDVSIAVGYGISSVV